MTFLRVQFLLNKSRLGNPRHGHRFGTRENVLKLAEQFDIKLKRAGAIIDEVNAAADQWAKFAAEAGCAKKCIAAIKAKIVICAKQWRILTMKWIGPITIDDLLNQVVAAVPTMPPVADSVYLISAKKWEGEPDASCDPLYVGGNTSTSERFRTRMGDLIADLFGFYGGATGHHSGGQSLNQYCRKHRISPKSLYVGWLDRCRCRRCAEIGLFEQFHPKLNKKRPSCCKVH